MEVEQREASKVAGAHADGIGRIDRIFPREIFTVRWAIVLHADRLGDLAVERVEHRRACPLQVDRAECVEVPVVVIPERARRMTAADGPFRRHGWRFVEGGMIDSRARLQEIADRRRLLFGRQRGRIVVDAQLADGRREINLLALNRIADQRREQALTHRGEFHALLRVAPLGYDNAVLDDHHRRRADGRRPGARLRQQLRRPAELRSVNVIPALAGEAIDDLSGGYRARQTGYDETNEQRSEEVNHATQDSFLSSY